jgi:Spy/CpxP family protein refolding chaperone
MADCMKEGMANCQPQRDSFQVDRMQFIQTLKAPNFNETAARAALVKSLQAHAQMEKSLGENLITMRKKMTAEQAKQFFDRRFGHRQKNMNNTRKPN